MGYFARILWSGARYGELCTEFMALVELAKRKGKPIGYVLACHKAPHTYHQEECRDEMITIKAKMIEREIKRFWPLEGKKEFPSCTNDDRWRATSPWLYALVVESWFTHFPPGSWASVSTRQWRKKPSQVSKNGNILLLASARTREDLYLRTLIVDRKKLKSMRGILEESIGGFILVRKKNRMQHAFLGRKIELLTRAIECAAKKQPKKIDPVFLKPMGKIGFIRRVPV